MAHTGKRIKYAPILKTSAMKNSTSKKDLIDLTVKDCQLMCDKCKCESRLSKYYENLQKNVKTKIRKSKIVTIKKCVLMFTLIQKISAIFRKS